MKAPKKCPMCSEKNKWIKVATNKEGFSVGKSAVGAVLLGPVGLIAGGLGKKRATYTCGKCQFKQDYKA